MSASNLGRTRTLLLCCAASAVIMPATAFADQADTGASSGEIVVTATRREQSLHDTPMAVDVVTGEAVSKLNIFDAKEIQSLAPGLQLTNNDGRSNIATLRGITFDPDSGSSPAVEIFINEVPTDAQTAFTAIYDMGQIEVLRGPQGLFRGRTSPAGAILLGTQRANVDEATGYAQGTVSNRNAVNAQTAINLPLVPGRLGLRAALLYDQNRIGYVRNLDGRRSDNKTLSGRVSLALETGSLKANLMYQHLDADMKPFVAVFGPGAQPAIALGDPRFSGPPLSLEDRRSVTEGVSRFQNRSDLVTLNATVDLGGPRLVYNGGYQDSGLKQNRDQDVANAVPDYERDQNLTTSYKIWNNELRLESSTADRFTWAVSANYRWQDNRVPLNQANDQLFALAGLGPLPPSINFVPVLVDVDVKIKLKEYGVAGIVGFEPIDGLKFTAGLRHTWSDVDRLQETGVSLPSLGQTLPTTSATAQQRTRFFTGGANLTWEATQDITTYASYARSYRPGVFAVGVTVPLAQNIKQTKDEKSDGFEVGVKLNLFDRKVSLNLAGFYQKFNNYISYFPTFNTASAANGVVDNSIAPLPFTGNAISKGAEAQLSVRPSRNIDFSINASYVNARYDNSRTFCNLYDNAGNPIVPAGQQIATCQNNSRLAQVPKFSLTANGEVRMPTGNMQPFVRGLVNYRPGFYSDRDNYRYRSYVKLDLFAGIRGEAGRWELNVFAKNLLNQTRALSVSDSISRLNTSELNLAFQPTGANGIPFVSGYRTATITPPREIGVTSIFRW